MGSLYWISSVGTWHNRCLTPGVLSGVRDPRTRYRCTLWFSLLRSAFGIPGYARQSAGFYEPRKDRSRCRRGRTYGQHQVRPSRLSLLSIAGSAYKLFRPLVCQVPSMSKY